MKRNKGKAIHAASICRKAFRASAIAAASAALALCVAAFAACFVDRFDGNPGDMSAAYAMLEAFLYAALAASVLGVGWLMADIADDREE